MGNVQTDAAFEEKQMEEALKEVHGPAVEAMDDADDEDENDADFETVPGILKNKNKKPRTSSQREMDEKEAADRLKYADLPEVLKLPYKVRRKMEKNTRDHRRRLQRDEAKRIERDCLFEEVPAQLNDSETDSEGIAEVQALGAKMLSKDKKDRDELINASYHRYAFDDDDDVPKWFRADERKNYTLNLPITKEEVMQRKARLKAANARPIKKVLEAKARKKLKAQRIWNKIKGKATKIADCEDLRESTKIKQIQKLYGALGRHKKKRVYMVATSMRRKARPVDGKKPPKNARKVFVDTRLKADKLGTKHAKKRKLAGNKVKKSVRRQQNRKNRRKGRGKKH